MSEKGSGRRVVWWRTVVEDVTGAKAEGRGARVQVIEVVESVCDRDGHVLGAIAVGVANYKGMSDRR